ncbi:YD repeat-containing protein [Streptomyces pseudovenezuelae]|uniref:YD repeat-containing protein n=1 Tax=Streptomyces pseudovenezuelae TaxID=67350 RepID=A0ABT6M492_9ACTN|nr:YD repeat-containing protein [Streptomyces pseudovenezuelae]
MTLLRDRFGRLHSETLDGRTITYVYDALGRRTHRTTPSGAESVWTYDATGRRTTLTTSGRVLTFERDAAGRELTRHIADTATLTHTFDPLGRLTTQSLHVRNTGRAAPVDMPFQRAALPGRRPYLRFWLAFLAPHMAEIERMRGDLTLGRIREQWTAWRGRAVGPLIRDSVARLLPDQGLPAVPAMGGYWTRGTDIEIDLVGADRGPVAKRLLFLGSIK